MATKKKARKKAAATAEAPDLREPIKVTPAACKQTVAAVTEVLGKLTPPEEPTTGDLVDAMVHIFIARGLPCGYGQEARRRIAEAYVDRNEFRITEAFEVTELLEDMAIPDLFERCLAMRDAVAQVYNDQNSVSLEFLREASVTDRNHFFMRAPALTQPVQHFVLSVMAFEECIFSAKSTQRVQQRLGLDPKAAHVAKMFDELRGLLGPYGHLPLDVGPHGRGKPVLEPALSPASLLVRLAVAKGKK